MNCKAKKFKKFKGSKSSKSSRGKPGIHPKKIQKSSKKFKKFKGSSWKNTVLGVYFPFKTLKVKYTLFDLSLAFDSSVVF